MLILANSYWAIIVHVKISIKAQSVSKWHTWPSTNIDHYLQIEKGITTINKAVERETSNTWSGMLLRQDLVT